MGEGGGSFKTSFMQLLFIYKAHSVIISAKLLECLQRLVIFSPYPYGPITILSFQLCSQVALNQENCPGKGFIPSRLFVSRI